MMSSDSTSRRSVYEDPFFGLVALNLGWAPSIRYLLRRRRILRLTRSLDGLDDMVEVGSGAGTLLCELSRQAHSAVGIETSPQGLSTAKLIAKAVAAPARFIAQPELDWDGAKDFVCAFDVLEHIEDDDAAVAEWKGWLKPGGLICISVPAHRNRWGSGDEWAGHWRRYDRHDVMGLLGRHGLTVEHIECYGFPLANLTEWMGERTYRRMLVEREDAISRADASAQSGVQRDNYMRLFRSMDTFSGRMALRFAFLVQAAACNLNLGSGYLVLARHG